LEAALEEHKANLKDPPFETLAEGKRRCHIETAIEYTEIAPDGTLLEEWADNYDLMDRYFQEELAALRERDRVKAARKIPQRPQPPVKDPVEEDEPEEDPKPVKQRQRPSEIKELPPGLHVGRSGVMEVQKAQEKWKKPRKKLPAAKKEAPKAKTRADVEESPPPPTPPVEVPDPFPVEVQPKAKDYFLQMPSQLNRRTDLSTDAKLLYAWLANGSKVKGGKPISPRQDFIATELGTNRRKVGRHAEELEKAGLIKCERRGARNPTKYTVIPFAGLGGGS